jgi:hypothetical protein
MEGCAGVVFVEPTTGDDTNDGSQSAPFKSYAKALESFAGEASGVIVLGRGTYRERLVVQDGVSVSGGFTRTPGGEWIQDANAIPTFEPMNDDASAGVFGMVARDVFSETYVHGVEIMGTDAPNEMSSYEAYLVDSSGVVLSSITVHAGRGGDGIAGQDGEDGLDGVPGDAPECTYIAGPNVFAPFNHQEAVARGGSGGVRSECIQAGGGNGGDGGSYRYNSSFPNAPMYTDSESGTTSVNGALMGGGRGTSTSFDGEDGRDAAPSSPDGDPGDGGVSQGIVDATTDLWVPDGSGADGMFGREGTGGSGGGGANNDPDNGVLSASGGGGGGGGGCGGERGTAGSGGGGSFGLFAVRSNVKIIDSTFTAAGGGSGGAGGRGGRGGLGADGASGTMDSCDGSGQTWKSGDGGDGGDGGAGGDGGGGAGGVSYGAYCVGSQVDATGDVTFRHGTSDVGGGGGNPGENGAVADEVGCL